MAASLWRVVLAITLLACLLACGVVSKDAAASPRDAWLQAPKSGRNWTRLAALQRLVADVQLVGMSRTQVLALLGQPGFADDSSPFGHRMDFYRLSAANKEAFRLDYDAEDKVTVDAIENSPCGCESCDTGAPLLAMAVLDKSGLMRRPLPESKPTMSAIEKMLGVQGKLRVSQDQKGGQVWRDYSETWRLGGEPDQFLVVTGEIPLTSANADGVGDEPANAWSVISFAPECLAK